MATDRVCFPNASALGGERKKGEAELPPLLPYPASRLARIDRLDQLTRRPKKPPRKPPHSERLWGRRRVYGFCKIKVILEPESCLSRIDNEYRVMAMLDDPDPQVVYALLYGFCQQENVIPLQVEMRPLAGTPPRRIRMARRAQAWFWEKFLSWAWDAA